MPEAYIDIEITGTEFDGTYTKDSRLSKIEDAEDGVITYNDLFARRIRRMVRLSPPGRQAHPARLQGFHL